MDCKDDPSYILDQPMCLEPFSKNAEEGELRLVFDGPHEYCSERECYSYKTIHQLNLDININKPDISECNLGGDRLDGWLYVCDLVHAFSSTWPNSRAFHGGNFTWVDTTNGIVAEGKLSGITNAGTHRLPLPPPEGCDQSCQECWAPGFMDGRFCGTIRRSKTDPSLLGCQIVGMYKLRFEGLLNEPRNRVTGVLEGVVIFECTPVEPQQSSAPQAELM
jgi:hypothetical protein